MARILLIALVACNLLFFGWSQGYFGREEDGSEPRRLSLQMQPEKIKVKPLSDEPAAASAPACRHLEGVTAAQAAGFNKAMREAGLQVTTLASAVPSTQYWVHISGLADQNTAQRKAGEVARRGVKDFDVVTTSPGYAISFGVFDSEARANELLAALNDKGVRSARISPRAKPPAPPPLEVRGPADVLGKRLPEWLANVADVAASECK